MKKTITLFTIALTAFSVAAIAQSGSQTAPVLHHNGNAMEQPPKVQSAAEMQKKMNHANRPDIPAPMTGKERSAHNVSFYIAKYDSEYVWYWDTANSTWNNGQASYKYMNYVYDANNNITGWIEYYWNGAAWVNDDKAIFTYNGNNQELSATYLNWNVSVWDSGYRYVYTYDGNGDETSEEYDNYSSGWVPDELYTFIYDVNYNETNYQYSTWSSGWQFVEQYVYVYNINNYETSYTYQTYSSGWVNDYRYNYYYYVANGYDSADVYQLWSGSWTNNYQYLYTYNVNNFENYELDQTWSSGMWVNDYQYTYTPTKNNYHDSISLEQQYVSNSWVNYEQEFFAYDPLNGYGTNYKYQTWDAVHSTWVNYVNYNYVYNSNNHETLYQYQEWVNNTTWSNDRQYSYTYDANNFERSFAYRYYDVNRIFQTSGDSGYYYLTETLGINNITPENTDITVYPNPSKGEFTIFWKAISEKTTCEIYNVLGEEVKNVELTPANNQLDLSAQAGGVYFYKVISETGILLGEGKLVVQK
jgi:hypothetical protein